MMNMLNVLLKLWVIFGFVYFEVPKHFISLNIPRFNKSPALYLFVRHLKVRRDVLYAFVSKRLDRPRFCSLCFYQDLL